MNYSRIKGALPWVGLTAAYLSLTPDIFAFADAERGYDATGGEIIFPLIPLSAYGVYQVVKDLIKTIPERTEEND